MNEHIKALAYKAELDEFFLWTSDRGNVLDDKHQKFAELLVQECMQQCTQVWYDANNESEPEGADLRTKSIKIGVKQGAIKCTNQIKQHFGINK